MSLLPSLGGVMLRALALTPGIADLFIARDETGALVGYTLFSLPGQLILSTSAASYLRLLPGHADRVSLQSGTAEARSL